MAKYKWVATYEGEYDVSDQGDVRGKNKQVLQTWIHNGFRQVSLYSNKGKIDVYVHRLVAQAFLANPDGKVKIRFKNGDKLDCRAENLEYGTREVASGKSNPRAMVIVQLSMDGEFVREWGCGMDIKRELGFNPGSVSLCVHGKKKSAYGFVWRKKE